jgi:hypothetical protein
MGGVHILRVNAIVSEVVYTNTALPAADRERLEGYLAWKWGLEANLPAGRYGRRI